MNAAQNQFEIQEYVSQLEKFCITFFKKCEVKTNQFSTKFILQRVVEEYRELMDDVSELVNTLGDEPVDPGSLKQAFANFENENLDENPDLENLNFVEAKNLAINTIEFVISQYRQLIEKGVSQESEKIISEIITVKNRHLKSLKSEYEKVRYK